MKYSYIPSSSNAGQLVSDECELVPVTDVYRPNIDKI